MAYNGFNFDFSGQVTQKQNEQKAEAAAATTTATTTTVYTEPGVSNAEWDRKIISEVYFTTLHTKMTLPVMQLMERCFREGMETDVILSALEATGWARRPSPQYLRAILTRCIRDGILTETQWRHHEDERYIEQQSANAELYRAWYGSQDDDMPF